MDKVMKNSIVYIYLFGDLSGDFQTESYHMELCSSHFMWSVHSDPTSCGLYTQIPAIPQQAANPTSCGLLTQIPHHVVCPLRSHPHHTRMQIPPHVVCPLTSHHMWSAHSHPSYSTPGCGYHLMWSAHSHPTSCGLPTTMSNIYCFFFRCTI